MKRVVSLLTLVVLATLMPVPGCSRQVGQPEVPHPRLITFSPALTRMTFDMGLGDHVVGVTTYCRLPEGKSRPVVGDNLNVRVEPILAVRPDLMLVQMELKHFEAVKRVRPELTIEHFTIETLSDIARAMERIGKLAGEPETGLRHRQAFLDRLEALRERTAQVPRRRVCFVMGTRNPSGPGKGTFIDEMIQIAGGTNVLSVPGGFESWKSPGLETITKLAPEVIICQCKPGTEARTIDYWSSLEFPESPAPRVIAVTDDDWILPAGHLAEYAERLADFIHPDSKGQAP